MVNLLSHVLSHDRMVMGNDMFYLMDGGKIYTGSTKDLKRRYNKHVSGKVDSTRNNKTLKLIHYEAYLFEGDARRRGGFLKTTEGKRSLKKQIRDLLDSICL